MQEEKEEEEEEEADVEEVTGSEAKATRGALRQKAGRIAEAAAVAVTRERLPLLMILDMRRVWLRLCSGFRRDCVKCLFVVVCVAVRKRMLKKEKNLSK